MADLIKRETVFAAAVLALVAGVFWLFFRIMAPFFAPIAWGVILVITVQPLNGWMRSRVKSAGLSAFLMTLLVALVIIVPLVFLSFALVGEVSGLYARVEGIVAAQGSDWMDLNSKPWVQALTRHLQGLVDLSKLDLNKAALDALGRKVSTAVVSQTTSLLANIGRTILQFLLVLMTMYYLFKDGGALTGVLSESIPLPRARSGKILEHITDVVRATIYGGLAVSALQGLLGGIMFGIMGIPSPVFWGVVMTVLTLVPLLGAFVVYLPAAAILILQGSVIKGIILAAWGLGVVSQIDNLLKPLLLSGHTRLHPMLLFFSIMGGLQVFGFLGMVLGPVVASVFVAVFDLYRDAIRQPEEVTAAEDGK
ncbi:MAG: AI-2E family transporter [candidate division Zixibacteria bacterium]|nr:AI-2E family transporter [candidate division Zixibacteria bacterium]